MGSTVNIIDSKKLRNAFINGGMQFNQRGNRTSVPTLAYALDRWKWEQSGTMIVDISRDTDVPTFAQAKQIFTNSMKIALNTADTSIGATDYAFFQQYIEGYNYAPLAGKDFTISFWVKATAIGVSTGIYSVLVSNSGSDRHYCAEYTINTLNTWEFKTVTIPAILPSVGTWNLTNGTGLRVEFALAAGSNFQVSPGSWQTGLGGRVGSTNQVNGVNAGGISHHFTGFMINEGTSPIPFSMAGANFNEELSLCQRYYEKSFDLDTISANPTNIGSVRENSSASGIFRAHVGYKVRKRVAANISMYSVNATTTPRIYMGGVNQIGSVSVSGESGMSVESSGAANTDCLFQWIAECEF